MYSVLSVHADTIILTAFTVHTVVITTVMQFRAEVEKYGRAKESYLWPSALRQMVESAELLHVATENVGSCAHNGNLEIRYHIIGLRSHSKLSAGGNYCTEQLFILCLRLACQQSIHTRHVCAGQWRLNDIKLSIAEDRRGHGEVAIQKPSAHIQTKVTVSKKGKKSFIRNALRSS